MRTIIATFAVAILYLQTTAVGQVRDGRAGVDRGADAADTEQKREWLRKQLLADADNAAARRDINAKLDRMTARQIDDLVDHYHRQLAQAQLELEQALAVRRQLEQQRHYYQNGNVGYAPVITWLPSGASLGVGATVSPDRRYVRVNANPFFSSVGPVHTFNWHTGQTTVLPPQHYHAHQPPTPSAYPETWYDGLRQRVGPRPTR